MERLRQLIREIHRRSTWQVLGICVVGPLVVAAYGDTGTCTGALCDPLPILQPSEFCSDHPEPAIATFEDANLEAAVRTQLGIGPQEDLTCGLLSGLTMLEAGTAGIVSLVGIQNFAPGGLTDGLMFLELGGNSITEISALSGLTSLTRLELSTNFINDISALSGLTSLTELFLGQNSITEISALNGLNSLTTLWLDGNANLTNIQPLLDNSGLGPGDFVNVRSTNVSCTDVGALEAKRITVGSNCE